MLMLALLPCLFFWRLLTPNPADRMAIAAGDFTEQYFPLRAFAAQEWVRGQVPLWNPYLFGGQPALADIQSGALYPPHLLESLLLGWNGVGFPLSALQLQAIAHLSLAAVGTYLFARASFLHYLASSPLRLSVSLRRARFGAVMTSLAFTYGGYLTGFPVQQITILEASAWLPWVLWAVSAATRPPNVESLAPPSDQVQGIPSPPTFQSSSLPPFRLPRSAAPYWGALAFAMAILAGHPQTVLYIFYFSLAYFLYLRFTIYDLRFTHHASERGLPLGRITLYASRLFASLIPWLIIVLLGAAIAAAQLLPTREFIAHSLRADLSYQAVSAGLPLNEAIAILYPGFFGGSPQYVGIVSLVLIALALIVPPNPKSREIFFWAGAGLVGLLLAFGGRTFLYPLFYLFIPGFEAVRQQERAFLLFSFSAAMLTGYGALILAGPLSKSARAAYALFERRLRWITALALALTAFFIYGSAVSTARGDEVNLFYGVLWHHLFGLLVLAGMLVLLTFRSQRWLHRPWGMALVALWLVFNLFTVNWRFNLEKPPNPPPFTPNGVTQFLQTNLPTFEPKAPSGRPSNLPTRIASGGLLSGGDSAASVFKLQDLTGNTPLQLASVESFMRQMPAWRLWQLLSVRYVLDKRNIADAGLRPVFEEGGLKVFEPGDPFPRAWFVGNVEVVPDDSRAIARLGSDAFDLRRTAVVPTPLDLPSSDPAASTVTLVEADSNSLKAEINASARQLLVFSQIYYPGWQAKIDGQPAELLRVNVVQQGVVVPAGQHTVELTFNSESFWLGLIISISALLICLVLLVWSSRAAWLTNLIWINC
jgi:hypothetical protein